jgi:hypothetical protein
LDDFVAHVSSTSADDSAPILEPGIQIANKTIDPDYLFDADRYPKPPVRLLKDVILDPEIEVALFRLLVGENA